MMESEQLLDELVLAGLLRDGDGCLTPKGRNWLRMLESSANVELAGEPDLDDWVMGTSALIR